jgi:hypothetical protein
MSAPFRGTRVLSALVVFNVATLSAAFAFPEQDWLAMVAAVSIAIGLPVMILLYRDRLRWLRQDDSEGGHIEVMAIPVRIFGLLTLLTGLAIFFVLARSLIVEPRGFMAGVEMPEQLLIPFGLVWFGYRFARRPLVSDGSSPVRAAAVRHARGGPSPADAEADERVLARHVRWQIFWGVVGLASFGYGCWRLVELGLTFVGAASAEAAELDWHDVLERALAPVGFIYLGYRGVRVLKAAHTLANPSIEV